HGSGTKYAPVSSRVHYCPEAGEVRRVHQIRHFPAQLHAALLVLAEAHEAGQPEIDAESTWAGDGVARRIAEAAEGRQRERGGVEEFERRAPVGRERGGAYLVGAVGKVRAGAGVVGEVAEHARRVGRAGRDGGVAVNLPVAEGPGRPAFAPPALALAERQFIEVEEAELVADVEGRKP